MDGVEVFVDGKSIGVLSKGKPLTVPGLPPGAHTVKGVKMGYEPDGPREETVYPGQEATVSIKILIPRRRNKAAADALDKGMEFYNKAGKQNYVRSDGAVPQSAQSRPHLQPRGSVPGALLPSPVQLRRSAEVFSQRH